MKIAVVGGGRMGLPLASVLARNGASVTVCDIDPAVVESINAGLCPYEEPGLSALIASMRASGRLAASVDTTAVTRDSQGVIVIVPAHLTSEHEIDLHILEAASAAIGTGLQPGTLVVYETTVAVGATRHRMIPVLEKHSGLAAGKDFQVAYSPERVKANLVLERLETTPKVVGGLDADSSAKVEHLYATHLKAPIVNVGSLEAAEMSKLAGMLYRDVNIALANELAAFCELAGVDFDSVRASANGDGEASLLMPGIGVGGHCTPVYPYFLTKESRRLGLPQRLSEAAREINDTQPARQIDRAARVLGPLAGRVVHILGLGFRPNVKVDTLSPAYALQDHLHSCGARVTLEDPWYSAQEISQAGFEVGHCSAAFLVVLNTAHSQFEHPDFAAWRSAGVKAVIDGRNQWSQPTVEQAGLLYFGIGRAAATEAG